MIIIQGYTEVATQEEFAKYQNCLKKLCEKWNGDTPKPVDSLLMWENRVEYRYETAHQ